jgi:GTP pyrophosphokinase
MITKQEFLRRVLEKKPDFSQEFLGKVFDFSQKIHTAPEELLHVVQVSFVLLHTSCDELMIAGALLHDVGLKNEKFFDDIEREFSLELRDIVETMTKVFNIEHKVLSGQENALKNLLLAISKNARVMYVTIANYVHHMKEAKKNASLKEQTEMAEEALSIYVPIARRLGIYFLKNELEDMSFQILYPQEYKDLLKKISLYNTKKEKITEKAQKTIENILSEEHISYTQISQRVKQPYSIFKKMQKRQEFALEDLYDFYALRIITDSVENCYRILGVIHKNFTPLQNRIKDYIAVPKPNGYQSLHTTVLGLAKSKDSYKPVEIQIRTEKMHQQAEEGSASHWSYKDGDSVRQEKNWIQSLIDIASEEGSGEQEILHKLSLDPLQNRIFVLTPKGDIKDLPKDATPIDFAYSIHTTIGDHVSAALVNGKAVSLYTPLKNGDIIEIKTNKNRVPNPSWLNMVKSSHARSCIKSWLKKQSQEDTFKIGRDELNFFLKKLGKETLDAQFSVLKHYKGGLLSVKERENLILQIGEGNMKASDIMKNIFLEKPVHVLPKSKKPETVTDKERDTVLVMGDDIIKTKLSSCCDPKSGDEIVGYITRGGYVSVHKISCPFVINSKEDRFVPCRWKSSPAVYAIDFSLYVENGVGIAAKVFQFFAEKNLNVLKGEIAEDKVHHYGIMKIRAVVPDFDRLPEITGDLGLKPFIKEVQYRIVKEQ